MPAPVLASLVVWLVTVTMVLMAFGYGPEARRVPLVVGVPTAILAGFNVLRELCGYLRSPVADGYGRRATEPRGGASVMQALGWLACATSLFLLAGYLITVLAFPAILMRRHGGETVGSIVAVTIAILVIGYLLLGIALNVPVHEGMMRSVLPWA